MRSRAADGAVLGRVFACALLVIGVAVMHHLVVTGCASAASDQGHAHAAHLPESSPAATVDGAGEAPSEDAPAAAVCLAVMLGGWLIAPLVRAWRMRRETDPFSSNDDRAIVDVPARPPDLASLSVSRT